MKVFELLDIAAKADAVMSGQFTREEKLAIMREILNGYPAFQLYARSAELTYGIVRSKIQRFIADLEAPVGNEQGDDRSTSGGDGNRKAEAKVSYGKKASPKQKG